MEKVGLGLCLVGELRCGLSFTRLYFYATALVDNGRLEVQKVQGLIDPEGTDKRVRSVSGERDHLVGQR